MKLLNSSDPLWLRSIALGVREEMPYEEKRSYYTLNSAALLLMVGGYAYSGLNLIEENWDYLPFSLWFVLIGTLGRILLKNGKLNAALILLVGTALNDFLMGYLFHNGMEDSILVVVVATFFVVNPTWWRRFIAVLGCLGYLVVRLHLFAYLHESRVSFFRYEINVCVALARLCVILEVFRGVTNRYQRLIEEKNRLVEQQRLMLDIERLTLLEKMEELEEANASKEELFSMVSHDLRGPIQNLRESLGLLQAGLINPKEFMLIQSILKKDVDNLQGSLESLLEWVGGQMRDTQSHFEPVSLRAEGDQSIRLLAGMAAAKDLTIANLIPQEALVWADQGQVQAIYRNLLNNAIKFTPRNGEISIRSLCIERSWETGVSDTGVGMESSWTRKLLSTEQYLSTRGTDNEQGLGLGLQICRRFVRENGGQLRAESAPHQGSTFYFKLPAYVREPERKVA